MSVTRALAMFAIAIAPACGGGGSGNTSCGPASATVMRVIDGDTVVLDTGDKVRYLMIDAPETTLGHNDCFGTEATQANSDLVLGKQVELTYDVQCEDVYGRLLAYIMVDGTEVNSREVQRGDACVLHISPNGDDRVDEFNGYEAEAKAQLRGMWGVCAPQEIMCE